jgi:hypothetical protein
MTGQQDGEVPQEYQDSTQQPPVEDGTDTGRPAGGTVVHGEGRHAPESRSESESAAGKGTPTERRAPEDPEEGNLVQLPEGATFGTSEEPSAQQREELARFAGRAQEEMQTGAEHEHEHGDGPQDGHEHHAGHQHHDGHDHHDDQEHHDGHGPHGGHRHDQG